MGSRSCYSRRDRETNILLIRTSMAARSSEERTAAVEGLRRNIHPSVISELDLLEMTRGSADAASFVDEIFLSVAPELIALHGWPDEVDDEALLEDVAENFDFVRFCVDREADARKRLDGVQVTRLEAALGRVEAAYDDTPPPRLRPSERSCAASALDDFEDLYVITLEVERVIDTALCRLLDDPPSRLRTLGWLRARPNGRNSSWWVEPQPSAEETLETIDGVLDALAEEAQEHRLGLLVDTARGLQEAISGRRSHIDRLSASAVEASLGSGACGYCAMHFSSIGFPLIDSRTPGVEIRPDGLLTVDRPLNFAVCPFCGWKARLLTPMVAAFPQRGSIIVCIPTPTGEPNPSAAKAVAPTLRELIDRARQAADAEGRAALDTAPVVETFSPLQFFYALQTGTAAPEHHAFGIVRLADGSRLVVDPTKHYIGALADDDPMVYRSQGLPELPGEAELSAAVSAFNDGDFETAESELRRLLGDDPVNVKAKFYLALAMRVTGREAEARRMLFDLEPADG